MKSKKGFISFIFILLCAAAVFVIGWVQLYVPVEKYGVLVSKTSGVDPELIQGGNITWKWQRLFPTNCVIHVFEAKSRKNVITVSGKLPSSEIYSALIEGRPDFSYSFTFEVEAAVKPEMLPQLVKGSNVQSDEDLAGLLQKAANDAANAAVRKVLSDLSDASLSDTASLLESVRSASTYGGVNITGIKCTSSKMPDVELYNTAKNVYAAYLEGIKNALLETTGSQIELASDDFLLIERFGKLGKVLTEYPILIDYLAVTGDDPNGALGLLDILRAQKGE